jgi:hypothetical protein
MITLRHHLMDGPTEQIPAMNRWAPILIHDLVDHLPVSSEGHVYQLTINNRSTMWVEAVPLRKKWRPACVFIVHPTPSSLKSCYVFRVPATVTTDSGTHFTSYLMQSKPQSKELTRGPPELVQHFRL